MLQINPIYQRELRTTVRDPKIVMLVMAFLGILGTVLVFLWPSTGVYSQATDSSKQVFSIFLMSNLALIILLVPALTSPAITSERENNSYTLLFTSLLTPGQILRGKLTSSITMILLVVVVSMPVSALCSLAGGIGMALLAKAFTVILMSALTYGILGLAISALCKSTFTALILTYISVAFFAGCTWLPYYLVQIKSFALPGLIIRCISPFDAMYSLLYPQRYAISQTSVFTQHPYAFYYIFLGTNLVLLLICLFIFCKYVVSAPKAGIFLNGLAFTLMPVLGVLAYGQYRFWQSTRGVDQAARSMGGGISFLDPKLILALGGLIDLLLVMTIVKLFKKARVAVATAQETEEKQQRQQQERSQRSFGKILSTVLGFILWRWIFTGIVGGSKRRIMGRFRNPIFVAEMRSKIFAKPTFLLYGLLACMGTSMLLLILTCLQFGQRLEPDRVRLTAIVFQVGIIAILAPAVSSGSITNEITGRTFIMLRMTPISALKVVLGKLKASFLYVSVFLVSSLPVLFSLAYLDYNSDMVSIQAFWRVGAWLAILVVVTILFITAGFCSSAFAKSTSTATAISYVFAALVSVVTLSALIPDAMPERVQQVLLTINPVVAALRVTSDEMFGQLPDDVWIHNLAILGGTALFFVIASSLRTYRIFSRRS